REMRAFTRGAGQKRLPAWSADGKWIAYLGGKQFEIFSLFLLPGSGGLPVNLTQQLDRPIWSFQWSSKSDAIFLSHQDGITLPLARVAVPGGNFSILTHDDALHFPFTISGDERIVWV